MIKIASVLFLFMVFCGCGTTPQNESLTANEIKFENDHAYCDAYAEFPVTTHPIYIKCMKDRGWNLQE